jgi:hypothetical protein
MLFSVIAPFSRAGATRRLGESAVAALRPNAVPRKGGDRASDCAASCFCMPEAEPRVSPTRSVALCGRIWSRISLKARQLTNGRPADGGLRKWDCEFESRSLQQRVCELSVPERRLPAALSGGIDAWRANDAATVFAHRSALRDDQSCRRSLNIIVAMSLVGTRSSVARVRVIGAITTRFGSASPWRSNDPRSVVMMFSQKKPTSDWRGGLRHSPIESVVKTHSKSKLRAKLSYARECAVSRPRKALTPSPCHHFWRKFRVHRHGANRRWGFRRVERRDGTRG